MKFKKGFTLAEVLIALGIIGVMAALMSTAFNGAKPDKTKVLYLKAYDSLTEIVHNSVSNNDLYQENYRTYDVSEFPLLDFSEPTASTLLNQNNISRVPAGKMKFANILKEMLNGKNQTQGCAANAGTTCEFDTNPGGYHWRVTPRTDISNFNSFPSTFYYYNEVELTIAGANSNFKFFISPDGDIDVGDQAGATYINNRMSLRGKNDRTVTSGFITAYNTTEKKLKVDTGNANKIIYNANAGSSSGSIIGGSIKDDQSEQKKGEQSTER